MPDPSRDFARYLSALERAVTKRRAAIEATKTEVNREGVRPVTTTPSRV